MHQELTPPRESVVDLALLLEMHLQEREEDWRSDDQVMDLFHLKRELKDQEERLDEALSRVRLQGTYLVMTRPQMQALRKEAVALAGVCMDILGVTGLLDAEREV